MISHEYYSKQWARLLMSISKEHLEKGILLSDQEMFRLVDEKIKTVYKFHHERKHLLNKLRYAKAKWEEERGLYKNLYKYNPKTFVVPADKRFDFIELYKMVYYALID